MTSSVMEGHVEDKKVCWGLIERRSCLSPTWRGWLLFALLLVIFVFVGVRELHPFLAVNKPVGGGILAVEGWAPDYVLQEAIAEFHQNSYEKLFVTGGPLERGSALSE